MTRLLDARPHLEVRNVSASAEFYQRSLGLDVRDQMGDPPMHAILEKDGVTLTIVANERPTIPSIASCYIDVDDVEKLFVHCSTSGVPMVSELQTHPWGMRDFVIRDPDGHLIACGERVR